MSQTQIMPEPGSVTRTLLRWLMRSARVAAIQTLSPQIRLIDLEGDGLKDVDWAAGQKIQVAMGTGLTARTYTPISWDAERGATRILAFSHGDGPGSRWASGLREGDSCQFLGPRRSLDLSAIDERVVLFGDETSLGLLAGLSGTLWGGLTCVLEVSHVEETRRVLDALGHADATLIERSADDAHLATAADTVSRFVAGRAHFVLTGKASSIQHISRALKAQGVAAARLKAKAYWAPGKTGMD